MVGPDNYRPHIRHPENARAWRSGLAKVYGGVNITVFGDRVQNTVEGATPPDTFLLAHVMAHEIAHILDGIDRHSETGLMKQAGRKVKSKE